MDPLDQMTDEQLKELVEHLTVYALRKMRGLCWRGVKYRQDDHLTGPGGTGPEDLAAEAIQLYLSGERSWNRESVSDFRQFLRGIIDSRVNHLAVSADNRRTDEAPVAAAARAGQPCLESRDLSREKTPAEVIIDREWKEQFQAAAWKAVEGEPMLTDLMQALSAGFKPADVAEFLDVDVSEVYAARKRLDRALEKNLSKLARSQRS